MCLGTAPRGRLDQVGTGCSGGRQRVWGSEGMSSDAMRAGGENPRALSGELRPSWGPESTLHIPEGPGGQAVADTETLPHPPPPHNK